MSDDFASIAKPVNDLFEDVPVSTAQVDVGCVINLGVSKMLASIFTAIVFVVSFVPGASASDAVAASQPTCCDKHAYCCVVKAACCGDRAATEVVAESQASNVARPTCCAKHAYCCVVKAACCGGRSSAEATVNEVAVSVAQPTCCAKHAYCCVVKAACCGKTSERAVEESIDSIG